jgi:hypothetical protein
VLPPLLLFTTGDSSIIANSYTSLPQAFPPLPLLDVNSPRGIPVKQFQSGSPFSCLSFRGKHQCTVIENIFGLSIGLVAYARMKMNNVTVHANKVEPVFACGHNESLEVVEMTLMTLNSRKLLLWYCNRVRLSDTRLD